MMHKKKPPEPVSMDHTGEAEKLNKQSKLEKRVHISENEAFNKQFFRTQNTTQSKIFTHARNNWKCSSFLLQARDRKTFFGLT
jgi:hypothetical protein